MKPNLLNQATISEYLTNQAPWAESHGADQGYLGMGLLYYTLVYLLKAQVAVCLGSGGGFVPRLMRQAQRDLGIAQTSRTILVDANRPEVGWGAPQWLAPESFFRSHYPDIELIFDLTKNAAQFFTQQQIRIDYLHIDADHSLAGCQADVESYLPLLRAGALLTLHDTNYSGSGVRSVVEMIRSLADCEVFDLPDLGAGTALVQIKQACSIVHPREPFAIANPIRMLRRAITPPIPAPVKDWKYLESAAFATRYVLAAHFVRNCRAVIEIGGAKTPIDQFLTGIHSHVLVIDPLIQECSLQTLNGHSSEITHIRACFQDLELSISPELPFGLVMLGMDFEGLDTAHVQQLYQLINQAMVTVIEFPYSWEPSRQQFAQICANTTTKISYRATLELDGNDYGDLRNSWPARTDRTIYVLEPRQ